MKEPKFKHTKNIFPKRDRKLLGPIKKNTKTDQLVTVMFYNPYKLEQWYCLEGEAYKDDYVFFAFKVDDEGCRYTFVKLSDLRNAYRKSVPSIYRKWNYTPNYLSDIHKRHNYDPTKED